MRRFPCPIRATALALLTALLSSPAVRAELPPAVYADEQRQAELVARLQVLEAIRSQGQLRVQARILELKRQTGGLRLHPGQTLQLRYPLPIRHRQGWVGPSPVPLLQRGQQVMAWLGRDPSAPGWFRPAAGGLSFGPSLENLSGDPP